MNECKEIIKLEEESFDNPLTPSGIKYLYDNFDTELHTIKQDKKLVAYIIYAKREEDVLIASVAVNKEYRLRGIGRKLVQKAIHYAEKQNLIVVANIPDTNLNAQLFLSKCEFRGCIPEGHDGFYLFKYEFRKEKC